MKGEGRGRGRGEGGNKRWREREREREREGEREGERVVSKRSHNSNSRPMNQDKRLHWDHFHSEHDWLENRSTTALSLSLSLCVSLPFPLSDSTLQGASENRHISGTSYCRIFSCKDVCRPVRCLVFFIRRPLSRSVSHCLTLSR